MYNILCKPQVEQPALGVTLKTIWKKSNPLSFYEYKDIRRPQEWCIIRTIQGRGMLRLGETEEFELDEDHLMLITFDRVRHYWCVEEDWVYYWISFSAIPSFVMAPNQLYHIPLGPTERERLQSLLLALNSDTLFSAMYASSEFSSLLMGWAAAAIRNTSTQHRDINTAIEYIMQNLAAKLSIAELARLCCMSERSFRDAFFAHTNMTPHEYIQQKRMNTAIELLRQSNLRIKEVAHSLGFANQYYFSRAFRDHFGISPSAYKKLLTPSGSAGAMD